MQQSPEALVVGHPQPGIVPVDPVDYRLQCEVGVETSRPGIAHDVAFRLRGGFRNGAERTGNEVEVAQ